MLSGDTPQISEWLPTQTGGDTYLANWIQVSCTNAICIDIWSSSVIILQIYQWYNSWYHSSSALCSIPKALHNSVPKIYIHIYIYIPMLDYDIVHLCPTCYCLPPFPITEPPGTHRARKPSFCQRVSGLKLPVVCRSFWIELTETFLEICIWMWHIVTCHQMWCGLDCHSCCWLMLIVEVFIGIWKNIWCG